MNKFNHRFERSILTAFLCLSGMGALRAQQAAAPWNGTLEDANGQPVAGATIDATSPDDSSAHYTVQTDAGGRFRFPAIKPAPYTLTVTAAGRSTHAAQPVVVTARPQAALLMLGATGGVAVTLEDPQATRTSGGEQLSSASVSEIPLNKRDFSALLLLAAGTSTDANGTNFTPQFAINGQRGVEATFAMDGAETSEPEEGGSTFSNFNVDAIESIDSTSGWMPAEVGHGASGFTNITTRSGNNKLHGSFFEFLRNSSLDARNYFDHASPVSPGRIPPFRRNEFGLTNGGPVSIPYLYNGRDRTFYFLELQALRQVLGTTQVFPVPTADERAGIDATAYPGDPLIIPVDPAVAKVLARYPLPNYAAGAYGAHTYAASAKILTTSDQFSFRLDHQQGTKNHFFGRVSFDNLIGPTTNPDQTAIDRTFSVEYRDHQRNVTFDYLRTASARLVLDTQFDITRTTPVLQALNHTDPAVKFNDGLFESFNSAGGSVAAAYNNFFSLREVVTFTTGRHVIKGGAEVRLNRDTSFFGGSPNGEYDFGGGTAYSPTELRSQSGAHVIHRGDALPDTLSSFLTGSPFVYSIAVAPPFVSGGEHIGPAATSRSAWGAFLQDSWKATDRLTVNAGLRYEHYTPIEERAHRTSSLRPADNDLGQVFVVNPQPGYESGDLEWGPRVGFDLKAASHLLVRAGGTLMTVPPNIWQDNMLTGGSPFVIYPRLTSTSAVPVVYGQQITSAELPRAYTPAGADIFPGNNTKAVPANTVFDVDRYERDLAALSPSGQINPLNVAGIEKNFGNAYLGTWTLGVERPIAVYGANLTANLGYIGTAATRLPRGYFPNAYPGASPEFAKHTRFDANGTVIGGFGTEQLTGAHSHSTYHAMQASLSGTTGHGGPGLQASYTWSKSLDDTSSVAGSISNGATGAVTSTSPQNPFDTKPEKGPSSFDTTHVFSLSLAQDFHLEQVRALNAVPLKLRSGWQLISVSTITSGAPFTIYSGVQQTGVGAASADRPDQVGRPDLSTARAKREDYFGLGDNNASFFRVPIGITGGDGAELGALRHAGPQYVSRAGVL